MLERFPQSAHYTSVYDECGLLGAKSLLGHGIHLTDQERRTLCHCQSSMVHCPSANLRLGSELMDYQKLAQVPVPVALGSDVAAGTSLSMFSVTRWRSTGVWAEPLCWGRNMNSAAWSLGNGQISLSWKVWNFVTMRCN